MLVARNNCSASIARASRCGQVAGPKDEQQVGLAPARIVEAVGGADQEARLAPAAVAPASSFLANSIERQRLAPLVEHDGDAVGGRGGGSVPPLSGSSVTLVGQAMRFK